MDARIRTLVENCVKLRQRSLFVIIGDKGRDQVVNLHYMLSKASVKARPSVLWCYKKDLYLSRQEWGAAMHEGAGCKGACMAACEGQEGASPKLCKATMSAQGWSGGGGPLHTHTHNSAQLLYKTFTILL